MEAVIAGCLEKEPAKRRQRVQNAVTELKLAGRSTGRPGAIVVRQSIRHKDPCSRPSVRTAAPRAHTIVALAGDAIRPA